MNYCFIFAYVFCIINQAIYANSKVPDRDLQFFFNVVDKLSKNPVIKKTQNTVEDIFEPGKIIPTIVPNQAGALPIPQRDIICNKKIFPQGCSTLAQWGLSLTGPVQDALSETMPMKIIKYLDDKSLEWHNHFVDSMLPPERQDRIQNLTQIHLVEKLVNQTIDVLLKVPKYNYETNLGTILKTYEITSEADIPDETEIMKKWIYCKLFKYMKICENESKDDIINEEGINKFGYYETILVTGVIESCKNYRQGCVIDEFILQNEIFEGYYRFGGLDAETNYPIYVKPTNFHPDVKRIIMFFGKYKGPLTDVVTTDGLSVSFVVNYQSFTEHLYKKRYPFIFYNTLNLPENCTPQSFPVCLNKDPNWKLTSVTATTICSGKHKDRTCEWDLTLNIENLNKATIVNALI